MTALNRNPINTDLLQSTKFRVTFARLPTVTYFCNSANLPGISLTEIPMPTPFVDLYMPGEKAVYDTAEYVGNVLPETIDMVCMDGGEFSSPGDWDAIKYRNPTNFYFIIFKIYKVIFINI